jgi:hypothetical protein
MDHDFRRVSYLPVGELFGRQVVLARGEGDVGVGVDALYEGSGEGLEVLAAGEGG